MPISIDAPLTAADVANLNNAVRAQSPDAATIRAYAVEQGVSVRTVQRWFTPVGQGQRTAFVPKSVIGKTLGEMTNAQAQRVVSAGQTGGIAFDGSLGIDSRTERGDNLSSYQVTFDNITDAKDYMSALSDSEIDPFLDGAWNDQTLVSVAGKWRVEVEYARDWSDT